MNSEDTHSTKLNAAKVGEKLMASKPARGRLPPSCTPPQKSTRGKVQSPKAKSSTPSGSVSTTPTRSFNLSPIVNVSQSSKMVNDKMEPKILKSLGPQLSVSERKHSARSVDSLNLNAKPSAPDLRALYMMYQQQLYMNEMMEETKDRVLKEGKVQLDDLWTLMKATELDASDVEARKAIVENHTKLMQLVDVIKPMLKETKEIVKKVAGDYQELTQSLDATRHKIHLTNIHSIEREALADEWKHLMDQAAVASAQVQPGNLKEIVQGAAVVSRLDDSSKNQIQLLDQCQRLSQVALTRLGQELFLGEEDVAYRKLSDFDI